MLFTWTTESIYIVCYICDHNTVQQEKCSSFFLHALVNVVAE